MATFDGEDWGVRIRALFPNPWTSTAANTNTGNPQTSGIFYALTRGAGDNLATAYQQMQYVKNQTRLASATEINIDNASIDLFGSLQPRQPLESDLNFATRMRQTLIAPLGTVQGIQQVVASYIGYNPGALQGSIYQLFGLDTSGGLETFGGLDGFNAQSVILPKVYVFDQMTDPVLAAKLNIVPPQFCVLLLYNAGNAPGLYAGRSYAGRDYMVNAKLRLGPPLTSALATLVNASKVPGSTAIYGSNYS